MSTREHLKGGQGLFRHIHALDYLKLKRSEIYIFKARNKQYHICDA